MMKDKIDLKVNAALESIDGISQAEPQPFLLTRILALQKRAGRITVWQQIAAYIKRPVVAIPAVLFLLGLNIAVFSMKNISFKDNAAAKSGQTKYDFAINADGIYDSENQE